jgi:hypothetical protein
MKKKTNWILNMIVIITILAGQICSAQEKQNLKMKNISLHYSDGNGNIWKISSDSVRYLPIEPEISSSGVYSGGESKIKVLGKDDFLQVFNEFDLIFKNKEIQIPNRIMTSGMLIISEKEKPDRILIFKDGLEMKRLEALLNKLISK